MSYKLLLAVVFSLVVGFAAASWIEREPSIAEPPSAAGQPMAFDRSQPLEARVRMLEQAVTDERNARQLLQDELLFLTAELEELSSSTARPGDVPDAAVAARAAPGDTRRSRAGNGRESRTERLEAAGFSRGEAERILRRESELQMSALEARYEAGQNGDMAAFYRNSGAIDDALRDELGEADYERYRESQGRATSVAVNNVIESSPAQRAGLQAGDRITRYDGQRVFSLSDITRESMQGAPGQQVVVDIVRDGTPMQVVMPRGPLGIGSGRWN